MTYVLCLLRCIQPALGWTTGASSCEVKRPGLDAKQHHHQTRMLKKRIVVYPLSHVRSWSKAWLNTVKASHLFHSKGKVKGAPAHIMKAFNGNTCSALHILNFSGRRMCVVNFTFLFFKIIIFSNEKPPIHGDVGTKYFHLQAMSYKQQVPPRRQHV